MRSQSTTKRIMSTLVIVVVFLTIGFIIAIVLNFDPNKVNAIASILVAAGTLILATFTWYSVKEAAAQAEKERRVRVRPQLVPMSTPDHDLVKLINATQHLIDIRNVGAGVAINIWGVMLTYSVGGNALPTQYSARPSIPIVSDTSNPIPFDHGGTVFDNNDSISGYSFSVPVDRAPETNQYTISMIDRRSRYVARLTLTYADVLGIKHVSIFDLTTNFEWVKEAIEDDILVDIGERNEEKGREMATNLTKSNSAE